MTPEDVRSDLKASLINPEVSLRRGLRISRRYFAARGYFPANDTTGIALGYFVDLADLLSAFSDSAWRSTRPTSECPLSVPGEAAHGSGRRLTCKRDRFEGSRSDRCR